MGGTLYILVSIAGLGLLMVVHEAGHYFAARAFGMRVTKFSIGIAPVLARLKPKGSPTTFQIGAIPFFAYVQIAGMNPLEEVDPKDKGSYANASLMGRVVTIFAGSLANYVAASIFFFAALMIQGQGLTTMQITIVKDSPAAAAGMHDGDKVVEVDGAKIDTFEQFRTVVGKRPNVATPITVERGGERVTLSVTPRDDAGQGRIGALSVVERKPMPFKTAVVQSVLMPPAVVVALVTGLVKVITGKQKAELGGPAAIIKEGANAAKRSVGEYIELLGLISANLAGFNLLPIPALDGGRLIFLGYEAVSRRRPDAMVEAHVHLVGFFMLLALMLVVTWNDVFGKH
jgi:regulator of sigma E protease